MRDKSFTLIELLVVIVIIGILAGVIMISTSSSIDKANIAKSKVFSESIKNSLILDLISEWKFDESSGNQIQDLWGNSSNGNFGCYGSECQNPKWINRDCVSNTCIKFYYLRKYNDIGGAAGSYIKIEENDFINLKNNQPFTIEYWLKLDNFPVDFFGTIMKGGFTSSYGHLISNRNLIIYTDNDSSPELYIDNFFSSSEIDTWVHIVQTFSESQITVYKNSQTNSTFKSSSNIELTTNKSALWFGCDAGSNYFLNGIMDNVRIYNAALSSAQIKQNYIAGLNSMLANGNMSKEEYNERINILAKK
ncbi:MAG: LamG-like jellyroll fold domain-containing protein [Minisyncoccales bacterium]|jgi:prepilin-type N-terminal cleavage/methylation domain-containing protein